MRGMETEAQDESEQYREHGGVMKGRLKVCGGILRLQRYRLCRVSGE